jgi:hypothetical protein
VSLVDRALDAQLEMIRLFESGRGPGIYEWLTEPRDGAGGSKVEAIDELGIAHRIGEYPEQARYAADDLARSLATAPTYVLTADMAKLVRVAADGLTAGAICPVPVETDLPTPSGFLLMEKPYELGVFGPDPTLKAGMAALGWFPSVTAYRSDETSQRGVGPGLGMVAFRLLSPGDDLPGLSIIKPHDLTGWTFGLPWVEAPSHEAFVASFDADDHPPGGYAHPAGADWRRFIYSVWHLCTERISPRRASRHARRRWQHVPTGPNFGDVRVIDLRRYSMRGGQPVGEGDPDYARQWSHRWVVSGHWHTYWAGPGRTERVVRWLDPYVKGPLDKPLIIRDDVFLVRR